jgi:hypothetical protein
MVIRKKKKKKKYKEKSGRDTVMLRMGTYSQMDVDILNRNPLPGPNLLARSPQHDLIR